MEWWDVVDENGARTGRTVVRGQALEAGDFHLAVHVWIRTERGDYLIQKRAAGVGEAPGVRATTVGHVQAGEDSLSGALRETREEVGLELQAAQLSKIYRCTTGQLIQDVYLVALHRDELGSLTGGPEVSELRWASKGEIRRMIGAGLFFPYSYFEGMIPD
ncbi:MAG: NUDIX domain-containing protein [Chloroflexi bacterium]|nr:NUDIX domain-containing protein [Chloroflexota bacterium]MCI0646650.1 NUDIX domain-containing protein [Chloroflexota bacterium]